MKCKSLHVFIMDDMPILQAWSTQQSAAMSIHERRDTHRLDDVMIHVPKEYEAAMQAATKAFNEAFLATIEKEEAFLATLENELAEQKDAAE